LTLTVAKLQSCLYDHLAIFEHSKMRAPKSHRYVKIMNNTNGLEFYQETFTIYSVGLLFLKFACCIKFY